MSGLVAQNNDKVGEIVSASEIDRHLGRRISEARNARGHSQDALANLIDIDSATLASLEDGTARVASITVARVSRVLDFPLSWFFAGLPGQDVFDAPPQARRSV